MEQELYINNVKVDLSSDIPLPITYSVSDFKEPESRKRSVSKTITLEGTQINKQVFSSAYQLSLTDEDGLGLGFDIDPTIRVEARYLRNGKEVFNGICQLLEVKVLRDKYKFEVVLFSDTVNLFQSFGDVKVSELDWSEYDHNLTYNVVRNSWDAYVIKGGVATSNYTGGKPDGFGYWYPLIDYGYSANQLSYNVTDLVPHVYFKEIFEKAFALGGYTIESDFIDSDMFKALTFGFGGGKKNMLPPVDVTNRRVSYNFDDSVGVITSGVYSSTYRLKYTPRNISLNEYTKTLVSDGYSQYDSSSNKIVIQRTGNYRLNLDFNILISSVISLVGANDSNNLYCYVSVLKNGIEVHKTNNQLVTNTPTNFIINEDKELSLQAYDYLEVKISFEGFYLSSVFVNPPSLTTTIDLNNDFNFDLTSLDSVYNEGDLMTLSRFIPEMKLSDFIKGVIKMFNLYFDEPNENGVVKIEPLTDFYLPNDEAENWTYKIDKSREQSITPSANIYGKTYSFEFLEDNDYYNKKYRETYGNTYGNYNYDVESGYQTGTRAYKVPFAQTVPVKITNNLIIPRIVSIDENTNQVTEFKGKPRIYFNNGTRSANWQLITGASTQNLTSYPFAHHTYGTLDNPVFDLNFGQPKAVFYNFTKYTQDNLFNNYHRQFVTELTRRDSKLLKAYFKLNENDIYKGMFRKLVNINGVLFRKNLITDFDANGNITTSVELLKVLNTNEPTVTTPTVIILNNGIGSPIRGGITNNVGFGTPLVRSGINTNSRYIRLIRSL